MTEEKSIYSPEVAALFERLLEADTVLHIQVAARGMDHQAAELSRSVTQGDVVRRLAIGLGATASEAAQMAVVLDVIQIAGDYADNIADREEDLARGRGYDHLYDDVPDAVQHCLAALMVSAALTHLVVEFPPDRYGSVATVERVTRVLGKMCLGQGLPDKCEEKIDRVSGVPCTLYCLPLWLRPELDPDGSRTAAMEAWSFAYGRIWQLFHLCREHGDVDLRARLVDAAARARELWPDFTPFGAGEELDVAKLLPSGLGA